MGEDHILETGGHTVSEACDGKDGLDLADSSDIDLVLTDLIMPNTDGIEVIIKLTDSQPALPIIAVSGGGVGGSAMYLKAAKNLGAKMILKKPFVAIDLVAAVENCLSGATDQD